MSTPTLHKGPTVPPGAPDRFGRLPLRAELLLLAHDDDTGRPHLHDQVLAVGLAGAILLDLWLADRLAVGWSINPGTGRWIPAPGRLTMVAGEPAGDPLSRAACALVARLAGTKGGGDQLRWWLRTFAAGDLPGRVRADLLAVGVLRRAGGSRYAGLVRTDTHLATHPCWAVRARGQIRQAVHDLEHPGRGDRPDDQCAALCGLVQVLGLTSMLYINHPTGHLDRQLGRLATWRHQTIRDVIVAVDAARGDLAVAAMR